MIYSIRKLIDCKIGDYVYIWCIGTLMWDNEIVKIKEKDFFVTVEYQNGKTANFTGGAICKKLN